MATTNKNPEPAERQSTDRPDPTTTEQDDRLAALPNIERNDYGTLQSVCCGASIATVNRPDTIGTVCDECRRDL